MLKKLRKEQKGFTIIEVLIVLAIAGLILLIVFLAVPALQRNQRNTARRAEAGRFGTAVNNFVANGSGTLPTAATWLAFGGGGACDQIIADVGSTTYYSNINTCVTAIPASKNVARNFVLIDGANLPAGSANATNNNALILVTKALCSGPDSASTGGQATARSAALLYSLETGTGNWNWACNNIQ